MATEGQQWDKAYQHFKKEGKLAEARWAREQVVLNRYEVGDFANLELLAQDPDYEGAFKPWIQAKMATQREDWLDTVRWIALSQFQGIEPGSFILATIGMVIWATILMQLCQIQLLDKWTPLLCVAGLFLGILSITPTFLWIILEDKYLPISEGDGFVHNLVYYIATVGLREEVCKLLLFLPLAPILIKRGKQMEFLLVASFVGLGFAYEENFNYVASTQGTAITGRFLTANFLHISLTGMSGLFFCRAWGTPGYSYNDFLYIFGIAILAHGLYDALLTYPIMDDGGLFAMILYIVFSKFYFQESRGIREPYEPTLSMSATMAFGISLLIASLLVYLNLIFTFKQAFVLSFSGFLASAIIVFMFFREFNESLSA